MYVAFDRDFARSRGIPTRVISYVMAALIAVTLVLSIRIMGIVLLISPWRATSRDSSQATISKFRPEQP